MSSPPPSGRIAGGEGDAVAEGGAGNDTLIGGAGRDTADYSGSAAAVSVGLVIRAMIPNFRRMQTSVDTVNRILREQITGVRVVRAFVREGSERERFEVANTEYTASAVAVGRLMSLAFPIVMVILNLSTVAVLWFGAHRIESGQMQIGALTAFMTYLMQILMSVMMATFMVMMVPRASVAAATALS